MASRGLGSLTLDLIAKIGGFEQGMDKAARHADKRMREIENRAEKFGKNIGRAINIGAKAIALGATAAASALKLTIDSMDEMSKSAQKVGLPTEDFSKLTYAAGLADVSMETLTASLGKLTKAQSAALKATSEQGRVFEALGIAFQNADGSLRNSADVLADFADVFKALKGSPEAMAAGFSLFGRSFQNMIPLLKDGSAGIKDAGDELEALGGVLSTEAGEQAEQFNDDLTRLTTAAKGLGLQIASDLLPDLIALTGGFVDTAKQGNAVKETASDIADVMRGLGTVAGILASAFEVVAAALSGMTAAGVGAYNILKGIATLDLGDIEFGANLAKEGAHGFTNELKEAFGKEEITVTPKIKVSFAGIDPEPAGIFGKSAAEAAADKRAAQLEQSLRDALENKKGPKAKKSGKKGENEALKALKEQQRAAKEAREELERLVKQEAEARDAFEAMAASLAGPLADANFQFIKDQERLNELAKEGAISTEDLTVAQDNLRVAHEKNVKAIQEQLTPSQEVIAALREEIELIGMSDIAQQKLIATRQAGSEATAAEVAEIERLIEVREQAAKAADLQREIEAGLADAIYDVASGAKSAGDAVKDFFDDLAKYILRMIAENWAKQIAGLFSGQSANGGQGGGTNWVSLIAGIFGGGKASGGWTQAGGINQVNERGFEMASVGGNDYMLTGSQPVRITPNHQLSSGGQPFTQNLNVTIAGRPDRRTPDQIARAAGREARQQMARTG